jgi:hypothetical protein
MGRSAFDKLAETCLVRFFFLARAFVPLLCVALQGHPASRLWENLQQDIACFGKIICLLVIPALCFWTEKKDMLRLPIASVASESPVCR